MEEDVRRTFEDLAAGTLVGPLDVTPRQLLYACFEASGDPDPQRRLAALRVAAHLPPDDQARVLDPLVRDSVAEVRQYAFNLACAIKLAGLEVLRTVVNGRDVEMAVDALGLLVTQQDKSSSLHARGWLRHADPRVRIGAAKLLGVVSGPAIAVHLGRLADHDPIPGVRQVAAEAIQRCTGEHPSPPAENFWEAGPADLSVPEVVEAVPEPEPPPALPRMPIHDGLETIYPDEPEPPPPVAELVPVAETEAEDVRDAGPWDWREPSPLPSTLPSEGAALLKLLGKVSTPDRIPVVEAFSRLDDRSRNTALSGWRAGSDPATGRGVAIAVATLGSKRHASMLRIMLKDEAAPVRAGAAFAVGATGTLSMIPQLSVLLTDPDADVRRAAVAGTGELLVRLERFAMLKEKLGPIADDPDPRVREAVEDALARTER